VSDKNVIFNGNAFADERVTGDLYVPADLGVLLNLHECSDPAVVSDEAPVQVHETINADILAELDVTSDPTELRHTRLLHS